MLEGAQAAAYCWVAVAAIALRKRNFSRAAAGRAATEHPDFLYSTVKSPGDPSPYCLNLLRVLDGRPMAAAEEGAGAMDVT